MNSLIEKSRLLGLTAGAMLALVAVPMTGCDDGSAAENAGEAVDDAIDDAGDAVDDAADEVDDAMDDVTDG